MTTMSALATLGLILVVLGAYWLPSILALFWRHPDLVPIVLVNGLLGWTVVGWVRAVWMLVRPEAVHPVRLATAAEAGNSLSGDARTARSAKR
jgi:hypothetical protein